MSIPATEMLYRLGHRHRALLRAGVMGLSAVSSAGCSRDLRRAAQVPEEVRVPRCRPPHRALEARRRGLAIAQDSGNRTVETILATGLSSFEAKSGDPTTAFDYVTVGIRSYHESGNTFMIGIPLVVLAALFDRLGRHEAAATIAGFA